MRFSSILVVSLAFVAGSAALADCVLTNPGLAVEGRLVADGEGGWAWKSRPGDEVRCDVAGHEPLDATCPIGQCTPRDWTLRPLPARAVAVHVPAAVARAGAPGITIEWRRFGPPGEATELLARRRFELTPAGTVWSLPVARESDRFLRFVRDGGAPETLFVPAADRPDEAEPPPLEPRLPAAPGGEIVGFVEASRFAPRSVRLDGPTRAEIVPDEYGFFAHSPLEPGDYRPVALFSGGLTVGGPRLDVRADESTEQVPWALPPLAAVDVRLGPDLCIEALGDGEREPARLELRSAGSAASSRPLRLSLVDGRCAPRYEGLPPGEWEAILRVPGGAELGEGSFTARADEVALLDLADPTVFLEGTVRIAEDRPVADLLIRATRGEDVEKIEDDEIDDRVTTDAAGFYHLDLPTPGVYTLELLSPGGFPIATRQLRVVEGMNEHDLDLGDAGLWVRVVRSDGDPLDEAVTLELWREGGTELLRSGTLPVGEDETLIYDLVFERYEVSAYTPSGWVSVERPKVDLGKGSPVAEVDLILDRRGGVVTIVDDAGQPIADLLVGMNQRPLSEIPGRPGSYSLIGANDGSQLRILPPPTHVPVCRVLRGEESLTITLRRSTAEAILIPPKDSTPPPGTFLGMLENLPESECPIPVSLQWEAFRDEHDRERIRIPGLTEGTFRFRGRQGDVVLQVPGPPVPMVAGEGGK